MLAAFAFLLLFQALGEGVVAALHLPVPGPVMGMLFLVIYLQAGIARPEALESVAQNLVQYLGLMFLPAAVGILFLGDVVELDWLVLLTTIVFSTLLPLLLCTLILGWGKKL